MPWIAADCYQLAARVLLVICINVTQCVQLSCNLEYIHYSIHEHDYICMYTQSFHFDFQHICVGVFTSRIVKHRQADSRAFMIVWESAEMMLRN